MKNLHAQKLIERQLELERTQAKKENELLEEKLKCVLCATRLLTLAPCLRDNQGFRAHQEAGAGAQGGRGEGRGGRHRRESDDGRAARCDQAEPREGEGAAGARRRARERFALGPWDSSIV